MRRSVRRPILSVLTLLSFLPFAQLQTRAQAPDKAAPGKPAPDVLVFSNGDQLTGKLERVEAGNVVFASDMAGELKISVDKVKELRSGSNPAQFALLRKGLQVKKGVPVPEGSVTLADGSFIVHPDGSPTESPNTPTSVPAKEVDQFVSKTEFDREVSGKHGFFQDWNGQVSGGATLVRSTTTATTLTAGLNLIRSLPLVAWLAPRNRTTINVNENYGKNTTPGAIPQTTPIPTPDVTTLSSIFHADAERDEYFSPRFYVLADTSFDHNYAQGLQLQEVYGGGVGWTPIRNDKQQLDLKVDIHYEKQQYITEPVNGAVVTTPSTNLIGSTIFESYHRTLPKKLVFTEVATVLPAFNDERAYSANATAALAIPVFKRLSASISTTDNFLNDPAAGYKKNSYQFVTGVTYLLR